jgi:hypothetical protein
MSAFYVKEPAKVKPRKCPRLLTPGGFHLIIIFSGRLTQRLEYYLHTVGVAGSNPASPIFSTMKPSLFRPRQFATPPSLLLVPYFPQAALYAELQHRAVRQQAFLHSSLLFFEEYVVINGFLGYPHLFTLLGLIAGLEEKKIYFLGSAGALASRFSAPAAVQVGEIHPSAIFKRFSRSALPLQTFADRTFPSVRGVSVDVIQRETATWLAEQRRLRADIVEMELFPLRWFLGRPFHALVVLSDRVEATGIRPFHDKERFNDEFSRAFHAITRCITHEKSHPDPPLL